MTLIEGEGRLVAPDAVEVGGDRYIGQERGAGHRLLLPLAARTGRSTASG